MAFGMAIATLCFLPLIPSSRDLMMQWGRPVIDEAGSLSHCSCDGRTGLEQCDLAAVNEVNFYDVEWQENVNEIEIDQGGHISSSPEGSWISRLDMFFFFLLMSKEICCRPYHDDGGVEARTSSVGEEESRYGGEEGSHPCDGEVLVILCG